MKKLFRRVVLYAVIALPYLILFTHWTRPSRPECTLSHTTDMIQDSIPPQLRRHSVKTSETNSQHPSVPIPAQAEISDRVEKKVWKVEKKPDKIKKNTDQTTKNPKKANKGENIKMPDHTEKPEKVKKPEKMADTRHTEKKADDTNENKETRAKTGKQDLHTIAVKDDKVKKKTPDKQPTRTGKWQEKIPAKLDPSIQSKTVVTTPPKRPLNCSGCFDTNFPTLVDQPELCRVKDNGVIDIVFLIVSAQRHGVHRDALRKTWASVTRNNTSNFRHAFMLGSTEDVRLMRAMKEEARHFRDVVVMGFRDSYKNLTLKVISSLRWLTTRCAHARFFVKVDDDVWINTPVIASLAKNNSDFLQHGQAGQCSTTLRPRRDRKQKWYIPEHIYPLERYPGYCRGHAYVSSVNAAKEIVKVSSDIPFFELEDVYVGMCLRQLGYGVRSFHKYKHFLSGDFCRDRSADVPIIVGVPPPKLFQLWNAQCPPSLSPPTKTTASKPDG